ncbi:SRPBCC domain-containing protein [Mesorhizobium sp. SP-1A]|uniref:SRPBCC domain-containing protein n=1 Tax=Mesorhizobium sp. SP-1A TaxID=3077840 RepID=UPI0028F714C6|nr:SRPBCC domain-containing protein [Mesorhizobium sp. SP-1A]
MARTDTASKAIQAPPHAVYAAFVDPAALLQWLPPKGMAGALDAFEPTPGGRFWMTLTYSDDHATRGKTSEHSDVVRGEFVELIPDRRIVQRLRFESADPSFAGTMTMIWELNPDILGTFVSVTCEDVPEGISAEDHAKGLNSSLENLAAYCESGDGA